MQASENNAGRNKWREERFVIVAPRDDDRKIRELLMQLPGKRARIAAGERAVDKEHGIGGGDEQFTGMCDVISAPHTMKSGDGIAQPINERAIR